MVISGRVVDVSGSSGNVFSESLLMGLVLIFVVLLGLVVDV